MTGRDDRDTRELLDELATTLEALRADLDGPETGRPPTPRELLRVTEEYTIPTVVATLEAAIAALELLRAVLRLSDPDRSLADGTERAPRGPRLGRAGESALVGAERALSEFRRTVEGADLPEEPTARDLVADARDLSAEVEARLRDARTGERSPDDRSGAGERDSAVRIEVETDDPDDGDPTDGGGNERPDGVDVDEELDSIRREVRGDERAGDGDGDTEDQPGDADDRTANGDAGDRAADTDDRTDG